MAEGRMLKKRIAKSRKFNELLQTDRARLLYVMMLPHLDSEGRIEATPTFIKADCIPLLNWPDEEIQTYLEELHNVGLIILYQADEEQYLELVNFHVHNKIRKDKERASTLPSPPSKAERQKKRLRQNADKSKQQPEQKQKFSDFVLLWPEEYKRLIEDYGKEVTDDYIKRLNFHIGKSNKAYTSHYYVITQWLNNDKVVSLKEKQENNESVLEAKKQEIREEYGRYYNERTTEQLTQMLGQPMHVTRKWLIREILEKRKNGN